MKDTIWKYPLTISGSDYLEIPWRFQPLHVGLDPEGTPCLWCSVDPSTKRESRKIATVGTGHPLPDDRTKYIGTFNDGPFVWHVYLC